MSDIELLELAAKAYGVDVYESVDGTVQNRPVLVYECGGGMGTMPYEERWDPLNYDVQAFRLAVNLHMQLSIGDGGMVTAYAADAIQGHSEDITGDIHMHTRRAIVRAAAEIGRNAQANA